MRIVSDGPSSSSSSPLLSSLVNQAVALAHRALFTNAAQNCTAGSRTFVHAKIYDEFLRRSVELVRKRVVGNPFDPSTQQGPQINESQLTKILNFIQSGKNEGAKLEYGGERLGDEGYFLQPTIFSDVQDHMEIAREEVRRPSPSSPSIIVWFRSSVR